MYAQLDRNESFWQMIFYLLNQILIISTFDFIMESGGKITSGITQTLLSSSRNHKTGKRQAGCCQERWLQESHLHQYTELINVKDRPSRRDLFAGITQRSLFRSMESHDNYTLADGMVFTENFTRVSIRQEAAYHVHLMNYKRLQVN
jgi:hypothetical protein